MESNLNVFVFNFTKAIMHPLLSLKVPTVMALSNTVCALTAKMQNFS